METRIQFKDGGKLLNNALLILLLVCVVGCASTPRTKWSDKNMRVMIDPDHVDDNNFFKLQTSLVQSDVFTVVDRKSGFSAVKKEQERNHRSEADRFEDQEKWSHWGKLHGVGSIIVPHTECARVDTGGFFHPGPRAKCYQYLELVDTNTGRVIVMVESTSYGDKMDNIYSNNPPTPNWNEAVEKLVEAYPKMFSSEKYHELIKEYQGLSRWEALRQKEELAKRNLATEKE